MFSLVKHIKNLMFIFHIRLKVQNVLFYNLPVPSTRLPVAASHFLLLPVSAVYTHSAQHLRPV